MSSHHRCIIHPQHDQVGVCGLCLRERLVALAESESTNVLSCSSNASDGAFHSFSSSSAREHPYQPSPPPSDHHHQQNIKGQLPSTSFFHKLKLKALISIPPSPEHAISKNSAGLLYSPSPKSKPIKGRKLPSTSELAADALHDRHFAPSALPLDPAHGEGKASLRSLFSQSELPAAVDNTEYPFSGFVERAAPSDERRRRIEQFSAAMRSPGFAPSISKAASVSHECYENGTGDGARPHTSWFASLFQRKKHKGTTKPRRNAMDTKAGNGAFEASARTSVDIARVSMDSASSALNLKQIIRSRLQQEEVEAMKPVKHSQGRPPLGNEHHKVHIHSKLEQPQLTGNINTCSYEFPARSSISIGSTISVSGTRISSTARLGVEDDKPPDDHDAHVSEQVRPFPRSRSCGRTWSSGQSPYSSIASPQHLLWGSSKQHLNNTNHTSSVKLSSVQHHYLTSTPKHPTMGNSAPRDSRVGFGFYFSPFRRSKRQ